jgi:hypothetical protein
VRLNDLRGARRRVDWPKPLDQAIARDDFVRVQQQQRQDGSLLAAAHIENALLVEHLERSQDPKVHRLRAPPAEANTEASRSGSRALTGMQPFCSGF